MSGEGTTPELSIRVEPVEDREHSARSCDEIVENMTQELARSQTLEQLATELPLKIKSYRIAEAARDELREQAMKAHTEQVTIGRDVLATQQAIGLLVGRLRVEA